MMDNIVPTVQSAYLQTCQYLGLPIAIDSNTTLNKKFNIHSDVALQNSDTPRCAYVGIGNGGHRIVAGADAIPRMSPVLHSPKHGALYNHLPFILRPHDNDLTVTERADYRLRRVETHNGKSYVAYYLKKLPMADVTAVMEYRNETNGVITTSPYLASLSDLNPAPIKLNANQLITTNGDYIAVSAKVAFTLTDVEVAEILNACAIIYGDESYAIISEMVLCSGVDRVLPGLFGSNQVNYTDAIAVQAMAFMSALYQLQFSDGGISTMLDIGSIEPLLVTQ